MINMTANGAHLIHGRCHGERKIRNYGLSWLMTLVTGALGPSIALEPWAAICALF